MARSVRRPSAGRGGGCSVGDTETAPVSSPGMGSRTRQGGAWGDSREREDVWE